MGFPVLGVPNSVKYIIYKRFHTNKMQPEKIKLKNVPISSIAGILTIIVFGLSVIMSIMNYPGEFAPMETWIGAYGNQELNPHGVWYFNTGCIITGLLLSVFFIGVYQWFTPQTGKNLLLISGIAAGILTSLLVVLTGFMPWFIDLDNSSHTMVYFTLIVLAVLLINLALRKNPNYSEATAGMGWSSTAMVSLMWIAYIADIGPLSIVWFAMFALLAWASLFMRDSYNLSRAL